jgi:RNA polymerase sigma-70 factor (ECF subfamily)
LGDSFEALVVASQAGRQEAFEELVRQTARLVFARLYLETGDPHRAEDLSQETFLQAWRKIAQVTDPSGFRAWLMSVAASVAIDAARRNSRKKRKGLRADESVLLKLHDPSPPPPEAAQRAEERQRALSVLRSLPQEYRMPLTLRYIAGADHEMIGRELGLTNGALRGLLHRGLQMMRHEMRSL